jgi:hypothetical protein
MSGTTNTPATPSAATPASGTNNLRSMLSSATGVARIGGLLFASNDAKNLYVDRYRESTSKYQNQIEFPTDLTNTSKHYISFWFQAYQKRSINNSPFLRSQGTIRLPMPDNLKDNTEVTYSTKSLNPIVGAALDILSQGSVSNITRTDSAMSTEVRAAAGNLATALGLATAIGRGAEAGGEVVNAAKAYTGVTQNPYQTVLFENPQFKTHSFTWKLIPSNAEESKKIKDIIRTFQFHMLPGVTTGAGVLFSFPSMVTVSLFPSSEYLYRFKPCVIDKVDIDYAPGGESSPSFYRNLPGAPTAISLKISLQEIEYWTNNDYETNTFNDTAALAAQETFRQQQTGIDQTTVQRNFSNENITNTLNQLLNIRGAD